MASPSVVWSSTSTTTRSSDWPPTPSIPAGIIAAAIVPTLIGFAIMLAVGCFLYKKRAGIRKAMVSDIQQLVAHPMVPASPPPNALPMWQPDAPTMARFFQELAQDKPVRFSVQQIYTFTRNYSTKLGSGGYGKVYAGQFPNGLKIAVKVLNKGGGDAIEQQFMAEVGTIGRTSHFNLVRLYGFCYDQFMSALVYEFMENGSLDKLLFNDNPPQSLEWENLHEIAVGTAKGLAYLHEECHRRIVHYDIKPGNVLLDANFHPKVADFGLAKLCTRDATHVTLSGYRGTPGVEIMPPSKPFHYLFSVGTNVLKQPPSGSSEGGSGDSTSSGTNSLWYRETTTPVMAKYEINVATS